jgi:glycosyltransferase involved in cell wall biosynthesis
MDVSIIIPIYRRIEWIGKCIKRLLEQDFIGSFEVIVVDDGSPNESEIKGVLDRFSNLENPIVKYIRNRHAGPAAARNYGIRSSSGKILCFLDDDSIPDSKWLKEIISSFRESETTSIVSGKILAFNRDAPLPRLLESSVYSGKSWATCNIAYRREIIEALGGFDESFTEASWEDNELGIRARWAGYSHVYNKRAVVYHPHERSIEEYKKKCLLNGRGAALFSRKYLLSRPLWGIGTLFLMSRRLIYGIFPSVWKKKAISKAYLKFLWSFYSLKGFIRAIIGKEDGKN